MGFSSQTELAVQQLQQMIDLAIAEVIAPLAGNSGHAQADLVTLIGRNRSTAVQALYPKIITVDDITTESTDIALKIAVLNSSSIEVLRDAYGLA